MGELKQIGDKFMHSSMLLMLLATKNCFLKLLFLPGWDHCCMLVLMQSICAVSHTQWICILCNIFDVFFADCNCLNGGSCVSYHLFSRIQRCFCPKGYSGDHCEIGMVVHNFFCFIDLPTVILQIHFS